MPLLQSSDCLSALMLLRAADEKYQAVIFGIMLDIIVIIYVNIYIYIYSSFREHDTDYDNDIEIIVWL